MISEVQIEAMSARVATRSLLRAELASRIAARHEIRLYAKEACAQLPTGRTASSRLPLERALIAMAEGALVPEGGRISKKAFGGLLRKFKQIVNAVRKAPGLWDRVKQMLGVESVDELPGKLKELARDGFKWLQKVFHSAFERWPLKIYTLPEGKLFSLNKILERLMKLSPSFEKWLLAHVKPKIDQFDRWMKENLPNVSKIVMVSIYVWIWLNVVEFEWNLKDLLAAASGSLSLADLLASLPASIIGFMMNSLGLGTFTLLPAALVARVLVLISARYIEYDGGFRFNYAKLSEDFGISKEAIT